MKTSTIMSIVAAATLFFGCVMSLFWAVSVRDQQATLKVQYDSKLKDNNSEFDNMWKTISQVAEIPEKQKDAYKEIFVGVASARTSEGQGRMMAWIKEQNPNLNLSMYEKLSNTVEAQRAIWTGHQKALVGIAEQYNKNLAPLIRGSVLRAFGFTEIDAKIVTSSRTDKAFSSGKDDDVQLFTNKK